MQQSQKLLIKAFAAIYTFIYFLPKGTYLQGPSILRGGEVGQSWLPHQDGFFLAPPPVKMIYSEKDLTARCCARTNELLQILKLTLLPFFLVSGIEEMENFLIITCVVCSTIFVHFFKLV